MNSEVRRVKKFNRIIHLSKEQKQQPMDVLAEFFQSYHLVDLRRMFKEWFDAANSNNNGVYEDGHQRSNLFNLYQQIEQLTEASYIIHRQHQHHSNNVQRS